MDDASRAGERRAWPSYVEAFAWLALAAGAFALTFGFDDPLPAFALGPAFWPRLLIGGIAVAAVGLLLESRLQRARGRTEGADEPREPVAAEPQETGAVLKGKIFAVLAVPLLYVYLIHQLGFYLVTPFFFASYMYLLGVRRWTTLIIVTGALYTVILLVFVKLVFTPLPQGAGIFHTLNGKFIGLLQ